MKKEEIFEYVQKQYGTLPEYLWSKLPDSAVLRQKILILRCFDIKMENGMQ